MEFKRQPQKFLSLGVDVNHPTNLMPPGKFPFLQNVRGFQEGRLEARPGEIRIHADSLGSNPVHSISRMNDYVTEDFIRFAGVGTDLWTARTDFSAPNTPPVFLVNDSGYSGNPLSFVPYRPEQSALVWMYIADANRMRKVNSSGTNAAIGIAPPKSIPDVELISAQYGQPPINDVPVWSPHDFATAPAIISRLVGVTVGAIVYVSGGTGWAAVAPTGTDASRIVPGMRIVFGGVEARPIEEVHFVDPGSGGNSIQAIIYDSGGTGLCTVQPASALGGIDRNAMLLLGGEYVRVISVTNSHDGNSSFRCRTSGAHSAGEGISAPANGSFWVYTNTPWSAGGALTASAISFSVTPGGAGKGSISTNPASIINWGVVNATNRPIGPDDYIHIGVSINKPELLVEGKLILDVDPATLPAYSVNDGQSNAYYRTFRPNDFQPVVAGTQTADAARTQAIQLQAQNQTNIDIATPQSPFPDFGSGAGSDPSGVVFPGSGQQPSDQFLSGIPATSSPGVSGGGVPLGISPSGQLGAGNSEFTEFIWKVASLVRIGSSISANLSAIQAVQFRFVVSGDVDIKVSDLWVGGSYGPDTDNNLTPFLYRYRYRGSTTGAKSLPGPTTRSGIVAKRQGIQLTAEPSPDPQVDKIDWERLGGTNPDWHYIGTSPNASPNFLDDSLSAAIVVNQALETDTFQPFPIAQLPKSSVVNVIGTSIQWVAGDLFDPAWARGTAVIVTDSSGNAVTTTLSSSPSSTTLLFVETSLPAASGVNLQIPEPIAAGQPLPVMWGPYKECLFACGDDLSPGSIYFTKPTDPDSAPDTNRVEETSPSETMMNGCIYDGRNYAFSDKRPFSLVPNGSGGFTATEIRGKGLVYRWGLAVGPAIWYVGPDGIYETLGGESIKISEDINPLFPQGDSQGFAVNGLNPVDMSQPLRLCYHNGFVIFDYTDSAGALRTLVYERAHKAWYPDLYFQGTPKGFSSHYSENGRVNGVEKVDLLGGTSFGYITRPGGASDDAIPITGQVWTPALDLGDTRAKKVYGDIVFDLDTGSTSIAAQAWKDNFATLLGSAGYSLGGRGLTNPLDLSSGAGSFARNLGVKLTWTTGSATPKLYFWEPSYLERPEDTFLRADDWTNGGYRGSKLVRGFLVEADTEDVLKEFKLQGDQGDVQTYTAQFNGQLVGAFAVSPPTVKTLLRLLPTTSLAWRKFTVSYIYEEYPELSVMATAYSDGGYMGAKFVQGLRAEAMGTAIAGIQFDEQQAGPTLSLAHTGNALSIKPYSFEHPFIAHTLRVVPETAVRLGRMEWVWEPAPEATYFWETQGTTHDLPGFQFIKDGYIALISTNDVLLEITVDGVTFVFTVPRTGGVYARKYLIFGDSASRVLKGKLFTYRLSSPSPFRLFLKDCEIRVKSWSGDFIVAHPFGDSHRTSGARI